MQVAPIHDVYEHLLRDRIVHPIFGAARAREFVQIHASVAKSPLNYAWLFGFRKSVINIDLVQLAALFMLAEAFQPVGPVFGGHSLLQHPSTR